MNSVLPAILPPALRTGDKIMVIAPSRAVDHAELESWTGWMQNRGYQVLYGASIGVREQQFGGSDALRAHDLQEALSNPEIRAIFFARGGYGAALLLDRIQWKVLQENPKWLCGYSDATAVLNHAHATTGIVTLHGPMPFQFDTSMPMEGINAEHGRPNLDWEHTLKIMEGGLMEPKPNDPPRNFYPFEPKILSKHSASALWPLEGKLIGGNLSVLYSLLGSCSLPDSNDAILIVEDLDEYLYHLDRMWLALQRSGYLNRLKAILIGDFTEMRDNTIPFGKDPCSIAVERTRSLGIPCIAGLSFGHGPVNNPLPLGWTVNIDREGLSW
ncbi:MAG: LD-carboxypeptidase [Bacteroidetes bacterium]|nr:LD-carboxypeptidase [Bacteroidota bacterium]